MAKICAKGMAFFITAVLDDVYKEVIGNLSNYGIDVLANHIKFLKG